ncbi:MAG: hypothetical protein ACAH83_14370 [Alphaproteobacteria bacterium]
MSNDTPEPAPSPEDALYARARAERIRQFLVDRKAPPLEEGEEVRKLSSNSTLAVIMMTDTLFVAAELSGEPTWEQYAVMCGVITCLSDAITQFAGLPREGVPYMVSDAIHYLFFGPDRKEWPKTEQTYAFAATQYKHMMEDSGLRQQVDALGGAFYNYLATDDEQHLAAMEEIFRDLAVNPSLPESIRQ